MKLVLTILSILLAAGASAQKLDSIYFNLYTDSLKKGTYNYINVDGKYSDGSYLPLGEKDIKFTASAGKFDRNSLFVDSSFKGEKITVTAQLIRDPRISKSVDIYIKKYNVPERLPTMDEVMKQPAAESKKRRRNQRN